MITTSTSLRLLLAAAIAAAAIVPVASAAAAESAPAVPAVPAVPAATSAEVEKVSVRSTAHFDLNQAAVRLDDQSRLLAEVAKMKDVTWQAVSVTGHTDSTGSAALNRRLAQRRAGSVKTFLVGKGVDGSIIDTGAKASEAPVAPNDTPSGRAKNRRTEVVFRGVRSLAR